MSDTLMKVEQGYSSFTIIFNCDNALVNNEIVEVKLKIHTMILQRIVII